MIYLFKKVDYFECQRNYFKDSRKLKYFVKPCFENYLNLKKRFKWAYRTQILSGLGKGFLLMLGVLNHQSYSSLNCIETQLPLPKPKRKAYI